MITYKIYQSNRIEKGLTLMIPFRSITDSWMLNVIIFLFNVSILLQSAVIIAFTLHYQALFETLISTTDLQKFYVEVGLCMHMIFCFSLEKTLMTLFLWGKSLEINQTQQRCFM